ncbi:MAG: hypothetical protein E7211_06570 [Clostridium lundense]|nr:hypothetical protein [Clostridium lundense]
MVKELKRINLFFIILMAFSMVMYFPVNKVKAGEDNTVIISDTQGDNENTVITNDGKEPNTTEEILENPGQENSILKDATIEIDKQRIFEKDRAVLIIKSAYEKEVQYKVLLQSIDKNEWTDITINYSEGIKTKDSYVKVMPQLLSGKYKVYVFAKLLDSEGTKSMQIGAAEVKYEDLKVLDVTSEQDILPQLKANLSSSSVYEGDKITLRLTSNLNDYVQYKAFIYSNSSKKWSEVTSAYTTAYLGTQEAKIEISNLALGDYKIQIRVKKANIPGKYTDSLGDYDSLQSYDVKVVKRPAPPKPAYPEAPKIESVYVGNASEVERINVRQSASTSSKILGYIYGSTQVLNILGTSGDFYYVQTRDYETSNIIKGYIRKDYVKKTTPVNSYSIVVDISDQKVYIYKSGQLYKTFICSTGGYYTPTPTGKYLVGGRGPSFGQDKGYICYNFIRINYNYLFHSVLHNLDGSIMTSEYEKLGTRASHGCIRLPDAYIKWMYDNIPRNALVVIQD